MNNDKIMGSLADWLLSYVSVNIDRDANFDIAMALLRNYSQLKGKTLTEIADLCYTSKSSFSRFCRMIGLSDYKEFQNWLNFDFTMRTDYSRNFYSLLNSDPETAISNYRDNLIGNIYVTISPENFALLPDIAKTVHDSEKVVYFSHHFLWDIGHFFQSKMMLMGKYVDHFMDYNSQLECAKALSSNDLAIICSVGGSYLSRYVDIYNAIIDSGCKFLVITQNESSAYLNNADFVLRCGNVNRNDVGKYAAMMANDLIVMEYMRKYDKSF